ncbi:hypothetical protein A3B60_00840 [Candidatus Peregrinibacteria bacterium RIFCSPLOWO2_01_FULL_39_12]|nr:MAG: hypothetical protein A3I58_02560 [Candidatus Peregrinibacteria bacterium RIFCSPLOWO2_02_FULL_39_10]OGJ42811.1 MAG: hypothetical protein A3B60_00840 [Candidatus Peregrinibacteria bacterium RIFCSPLOWO2_01_FULL_39_12]
MDKFLAVIVGMPLAFVILYYRRAIKEFIGDVSFAEQYLGMGGTNTLIIIIGFLVFIGSLMYALGTLQSLTDATLGRFFK